MIIFLTTFALQGSEFQKSCSEISSAPRWLSSIITYLQVSTKETHHANNTDFESGQLTSRPSDSRLCETHIMIEKHKRCLRISVSLSERKMLSQPSQNDLKNILDTKRDSNFELAFDSSNYLVNCDFQKVPYHTR